MLSLFPNDGRALPDGFDPRTGSVSCGVARVLDQGLLFLALNADVVRDLVQRTPWYASARARLAAMDTVLAVTAAANGAALPAAAVSGQ